MSRAADVRRALLADYNRARALRELPPGAPRAGYRVSPVRALVGDEPPAPGDPAPTGTGTTADVYLYSEIGGWAGVTADDFARDVAPLDVDVLQVLISSPGGDATEGAAIANVLRAHRARVIVRVDGIAASAASVVAMAGDEVILGIGSSLMLHDCWAVAVGNAAELEQAARAAGAISDALASTYAARAGGTAAEWRQVMVAETWYTADEAVAAGLADRVASPGEVGTAGDQQIHPGRTAAAEWDLWATLADPTRFDLAAYAYRYPGREHAPDPAMPGRTTPTQEDDVKLSDLRTRLDLPDTADEPAVLAALDARLGTGTPPARPDHAELARLRAVEAQHLLGERERQVDAAVRTGAIPPAKRAQWLASLEADPSMAAVLAGLPAGLIPVGPPIGRSGPGAGDQHGHDDQPNASLRSGADLYHRQRHSA